LLCNDPLLRYPDFTKPFILTTDASNFAIGAVLSQGTMGSDRPIAFASRTLNEAEVNYSTVEREMLAIVWGIQHFRPYLFGHKFTIVTDHRPLTWLMGFKEPNFKLVRWKLQLLEYDYEVTYKKGSQNVVADALSRIELQVHNSELESTQATCAGQTSELELSSIHVAEKPLNDFNIQLLFEVGLTPGRTVVTPFRNKIRRTITEKEFTKEEIAKILKEVLKPYKICAIYTSDEVYKEVEEAFQSYFSKSKLYKAVRCLTFMREITDISEQREEIERYHTSGNHRGIDETFWKMRRDIYFPFMKNRVTQVIIACETCQTLKYDRQPQRWIFNGLGSMIKIVSGNMNAYDEEKIGNGIKELRNETRFKFILAETELNRIIQFVESQGLKIGSNEQVYELNIC